MILTAPYVPSFHRANKLPTNLSPISVKPSLYVLAILYLFLLTLTETAISFWSHLMFHCYSCCQELVGQITQCVLLFHVVSVQDVIKVSVSSDQDVSTGEGVSQHSSVGGSTVVSTLGPVHHQGVATDIGPVSTYTVIS